MKRLIEYQKVKIGQIHSQKKRTLMEELNEELKFHVSQEFIWKLQKYLFKIFSCYFIMTFSVINQLLVQLINTHTYTYICLYIHKYMHTYE